MAKRESKETLTLICESCDSESTVKWAKHAVSNPLPQYCPFCGFAVEVEEDDREDDEEEADEDREDNY